MKKLSALIVFTLLATAGYYIGNAVAQNKNAQDSQANGNGVLVVEEEYGVVVPAPANTQADTKMPTTVKAKKSAVSTSTAGSNASGQSNNGSGQNNNTSANDNADVTVEETVTEEGYVVE